MVRLLLLFFFSLSSHSVFAKKEPSTIELHHYQAQKLVATGKILSLSETLAGITALCNGEFLDAHLYQIMDKWQYDLTIKLVSGQLVNLSADAQTGILDLQVPLPIECIENETATR